MNKVNLDILLDVDKFTPQQEWAIRENYQWKISSDQYLTKKKNLSKTETYKRVVFYLINRNLKNLTVGTSLYNEADQMVNLDRQNYSTQKPLVSKAPHLFNLWKRVKKRA